MKTIRQLLQTLLYFIVYLTQWNTAAQTNTNNIVVNDKVVDRIVLDQTEKIHGVKFVPGNYWYDHLSGAFGVKGGPCLGLGVAGLSFGGPLKTNASTGGTGVFINGRDLHPLDVAGLQTFMQPQPGRYWMDSAGNFGYENSPVLIGNVYRLYQLKFGKPGEKKSSSYKSNVWSGETTSFGSDGTFMYYSSKKSDGTTYDYLP